MKFENEIVLRTGMETNSTVICLTRETFAENWKKLHGLLKKLRELLEAVCLQFS